RSRREAGDPRIGFFEVRCGVIVNFIGVRGVEAAQPARFGRGPIVEIVGCRHGSLLAIQRIEEIVESTGEVSGWCGAVIVMDEVRAEKRQDERRVSRTEQTPCGMSLI